MPVHDDVNILKALRLQFGFAAEGRVTGFSRIRNALNQRSHGRQSYAFTYESYRATLTGRQYGMLNGGFVSEEDARLLNPGTPIDRSIQHLLALNQTEGGDAAQSYQVATEVVSQQEERKLKRVAIIYFDPPISGQQQNLILQQKMITSGIKFEESIVWEKGDATYLGQTLSVRLGGV